MARSGRYVNTQPSTENLLALWNAIETLQTRLNNTITSVDEHAATISTLQDDLNTTTTTAKHALIAVGKMTSTATTPAPGTSGGTSGGGSGGSSDSHPNHLDLITQSKNELVALGTDLSGSCGAFKIIQRAMPWIQASDPTAGYLSKPSGNNCGGFAVDIVMYSDGVIYDVLTDAGASNGPAWNFAGSVDPTRYRATA